MKFQPGQSGNPAGRKKGSGTRQKLYEEYLVPHGPELLKKAIELALKPDKTMLCALLDKLLPRVKDDESVDTNALLERLIDKL